MVLDAFGYEIIAKARNGKRAVELYKNLPKTPDLVLMDHRMPIKTGLEATKEILEFDPKARVIIATADKEVQEEAEALNIHSFKVKPFSNDRLIRNVKKALEGPSKEKLIES